MALEYDLRTVKDREATYPPTDEGHMHPVTYTLVMGHDARRHR
jgi:hypothetical protein